MSNSLACSRSVHRVVLLRVLQGLVTPALCRGPGGQPAGLRHDSALCVPNVLALVGFCGSLLFGDIAAADTTPANSSYATAGYRQAVYQWSLQRNDGIRLQLPAIDGRRSADMRLGLQRAHFRRALELIKAGENENLDPLLRALAGYPLVPYLHYQQLREQLTASPDEQPLQQIAAFRQQFDNDRLAGLLVKHLQSRLIKQKNWDLFLQASALPGAADRHCATARAHAETNQPLEWTPDLIDLWTRGSSTPALCREVLDNLASKELPGFRALWEHVYKSISDRRFTDTRQTAGLLTRGDRDRVLAWLDAIDDPSSFLGSDALATDDLLNRRILLDLLRRWSREDPHAAVAYWHRERRNYGFSADTRYDTDREMALRGAWLRLPEAYEWLHAFDVRPDDLEVMEWRVRSALYAGDWAAVLRSLLALPDSELIEDHWAYWHARALVELDRQAEAKKIFTWLAKLPTYYGFLAADKLQQPYRIRDAAIVADQRGLQQLRTDSNLIRAREYLHTGILWEGRRLWNEVVDALSAEDRAASALVAVEWGLPDRAIASANAAGRKDALAYRFPLAFNRSIEQAAARYGLERDFILAVARRESAFMPDVKSPAGAIGLMQLMPATAGDVFRQQSSDERWDLKGRSYSLTRASTSIDMGSFYLDRIGQRFNGHLALMAASYNAGPHRTRAWLPEQGGVAADRWIDTIPFTETRRYVRAVLAYMTIFQWRRQQLAQLAAGVAATDTATQDDALPATGINRLSDYLLPVTADADATLQDADNS